MSIPDLKITYFLEGKEVKGTCRELWDCIPTDKPVILLCGETNIMTQSILKKMKNKGYFTACFSTQRPMPETTKDNVSLYVSCKNIDSKQNPVLNEINNRANFLHRNSVCFFDQHIMGFGWKTPQRITTVQYVHSYRIHDIFRGSDADYVWLNSRMVGFVNYHKNKKLLPIGPTRLYEKIQQTNTQSTKKEYVLLMLSGYRRYIKSIGTLDLYKDNLFHIVKKFVHLRPNEKIIVRDPDIGGQLFDTLKGKYGLDNNPNIFCSGNRGEKYMSTQTADDLVGKAKYIITNTDTTAPITAAVVYNCPSIVFRITNCNIPFGPNINDISQMEDAITYIEQNPNGFDKHIKNYRENCLFNITNVDDVFIQTVDILLRGTEPSITIHSDFIKSPPPQ
jgi:hypothetical protein